MSDQFPHKQERNIPKDILDQSSALLEELAKLRQDIEHDSRLELESSVHRTTCRDIPQEGYVPMLGDFSVDKKNDLKSDVTFETYLPKLSRPIYRFDYGHIGRENTQYSASETSRDDWRDQQNTYRSAYTDDFEDFRSTNTPPTEQPVKSSQIPTAESPSSSPRQTHRDDLKNDRQTEQRNEQQKYRRYDDSPVVIPIRERNTATKQGISSKKQCIHQFNHYDQPELYDESALTLPWRFISRYENENRLKFISLASNLALFFGWGAVAGGTLVFARSFFVSSMIWTNYGLPALSLGGVFLFLGIMLGILAEKMQQINDLKQSLTTQRILNKSGREIAPPHEIAATKYQTEYHNVSNGTDERPESDDVYDRLIKLRSEINELIDECETP